MMDVRFPPKFILKVSKCPNGLPPKCQHAFAASCGHYSPPAWSSVFPRFAPPSTASPMAPLRVVEFFSGIGGMRLALPREQTDLWIYSSGFGRDVFFLQETPALVLHTSNGILHNTVLLFQGVVFEKSKNLSCRSLNKDRRVKCKRHRIMKDYLWSCRIHFHIFFRHNLIVY